MVHHKRRCSVCCHPEREAIEEAFLDWGNVSHLTEEYHLPGRTAIYRHARALGLDTRPRRQLPPRPRPHHREVFECASER
ncbi:MAG: hypothetical protein ABR973_12185 [Candidatus Acidiferrales bacterium]|jgi:hypothetical protein